MSAGGLPNVGVQAVVLGQAQFNAAIMEINRALMTVNDSVRQVAVNTSRSAVQSNTAMNSMATTADRAMSTYQRAWYRSNLITIAAGNVIAHGVSRMIGSILELPVAAFKASAAFEQNMNTVQVLSGATADQMRLLGDESIQLAQNFSAGINTISEAAGQLIKAGLNIEQVLGGALKAVVILREAMGGDASLDQATRLVANAVQVWNLETKEITNVVNGAVAAVQRSAISMVDFLKTLQQASGVSKIAGLSFQDLAVTTALLGNEFIKNSDAGTAMRTALLRLFRPGNEATDIMKKFSVSLFDSKGATIEWIQVIAQLEKSFSDEAVALGRITEMERANALAILGTNDAVRAFIALANSGVKGYQAMIAEMRRLEGFDVATRMLLPLNKQLEISGNILETWAVSAGRGTSALTTLAHGFNQVLRSVDVKIFENLGDSLANFVVKSAREAYQLGAAAMFVGASFQQWLVPILAIIDTGPELESSLKNVNKSIDDQIFTVNLLGETDRAVLTHIIAFGETSFEMYMLAADAADEWGIRTQSSVDTVLEALGELGSDGLGILVNFYNNKIDLASRAWTKITKIFADAVNNVLGSLAALVSAAEGVPVLSDLVSGFKSVGSAAGIAFGEAALAVSGFVKSSSASSAQWAHDSGESFNSVTNNLSNVDRLHKLWTDRYARNLIKSAGAVKAAEAGVNDFTSGMRGALEKSGRDFDNYVKTIQEAIDKIRAEMASPGAALAESGLGATPALGFPSGGDDGGKAKKLTKGQELKALINVVKSLLRDVPGLTDSLHEYIAELAIEEPARLAPMISAIRESKAEIGAAVLGKKSLLDASMALQASEKKLAGLARQQQKNDIAHRLAVIDYDRQLLGLRFELLAIDQQMAPLRQRLTNIEREMQLLQAENLNIAKRRAEVEQQLLPLRFKLEDIEQRITDSQRENLKLEQLRLLTEQQILPLTNQIADIDARIAELAKTNLVLEKQKLLIRQAVLPLQRQQEDIDERINKIQRENFETVRARLELELQALPLQRQAEIISKKINDLNHENFVATRERLNAELAMLPIKRQIEDIEKSITDSVNKREQLESRRNEIVAEGEVSGIQQRLEATSKALEGAWSEFNVPEILRLEELKNAITAELEPAEARLTQIQREQQETATKNELVQIGLELEKIALEELLTPYEKKILEIEREQEEVELKNSIVAVGLREELRAIQELLGPINDKLLLISQEQEEQDLKNEITLTGLRTEKQRIQDLIEPYAKKLRDIIQEQEDQELKNSIIANGLETEKRLIEALVKPLADKIIAIEREQTEYELRNEIVRVGLEQERQAILDQMKPLEDKLKAIIREREEETARNTLILIQLEAERRAIIEQLKPLEDKRKEIELQTAAIDLQKAATSLAFQQHSLEIEKAILEEQARKLALEETHAEQEALFLNLFKNFLEAITRSGEFTEEEGEEVSKRLNFWDAQAKSLLQTEVAFRKVKEQADAVAKSIHDIPAYKLSIVEIRTIRTTGPGQTGAGQTATPATPGAAPAAPGDPGSDTPPSNGPEEAPVDTGPPTNEGSNNSGNTAQSMSVPTAVRTAQSTIVNNNSRVTNNVTNIDLDAHYRQVQSEASIREDLRAVIAASRR